MKAARLTAEEIETAHANQVKQFMCENSLLWFARYFFRKREAISFRVNWHHKRMCDALTKVHRGEIRNLIINVPPGSSKTELAVIAFMAWSLAKNPRCRFLHLSYADTLVEENSSKVKDLIESEEYQALWPLQARKDSKAKKRWNVEIDGKRAGGCYAVALGGTITGFRAGHMAPGFQGAIIIDDPLKPEDAFSEAKLAAANRKLSDTVRSRKANPDTPVIIIMQRLHVDDATGYALDGKIGGLKFEQIKIPALTENEDGSKSSYWPYKEPVEELEAWQEANPYTFSGQMQQEPTVLGGTVFRADWWKFYGDDYEPLPTIVQSAVYADTAQKTKEHNDYSVFQWWGLGVNRRIYLLDQVRGKWEAPELEATAIRFWKLCSARKDLPTPVAFKVEDKSSGTGLIQSIQRIGGVPVLGVPRGTDKLVRAFAGAPQVQAGNVFLPSGAPWLSDYLAELTAFAADMSHKHDDQFDPTMDAIQDLLIDGNLYANL